MYAQDAWNNNSSTDKIPQSRNNVNPANEYSPEYQNGAEHPETVGAMESDKQNITRAINENGALPQKKSRSPILTDTRRITIFRAVKELRLQGK